jgi:hypothetical protein
MPVHPKIKLVRKIAADAFTDAIDIMQLIDTLEASNAPAVAALCSIGRTQHRDASKTPASHRKPGAVVRLPG